MDKVLTYKEKLEKQIKTLTDRLEELKKEYYKVEGGLMATQGLLSEYLKDVE